MNMQPTSSTVAGAADETIAGMMERYLAGDERALRTLYRRLRPLLRRTVEQRLFDTGRIDDVLQTTFIKAHLSRKRFRWEGLHSDQAVVRWYGAIARHSALDEVRRNQRRSRRVQEVVRRANADGDDGFALRMETGNLEDALVENEQKARRIERVQDAVAALPPAQRQVVELHRLQGLTAEEVGERLHLRPVTIRVRAHRAQKKLAVTLQPAAAA